MDKAQAINAFWNGFDLPAYDAYTVPQNISLPYITYEVSTAELDEPVLLSASLWYRDTSWKAITEKTEEIAEYIKRMTPIKVDNGRVFITKGSPFSQRMDEPDDATIRRILLYVNVEYLTNY